MTSITITPLYAALLALLYFALAFNVVRQRKRHQVGLGDAGKADLLKAVRIHGNFAEYVPLLLVLMLLAELTHAPGWILHVMGGLLLLGRVAHAQGLYQSAGVSTGRMIGMLATFATLFTGVALCLIAAFQ